MATITIEVDEDTERRLSELSSGAGISIQELTSQALLSYIEDMEDYRIAESRLRDNLPAIPIEEVVHRLGLED
jgi:RHH-type transcriptional regulator, rel operon repressor / antitoxin RelB